MSTAENPSTDIESGRRRRSRRPSVSGSSETTTNASRCSSDECKSSEIDRVLALDPNSHGESSESNFSSEDVDLESGELELKLHLSKEERECRICHLNLVGDEESGVAIELGCDCKGDLAAAHKQCAETWFKIRGNIACEICGATVLNVVRDQAYEPNGAAASATAASAIQIPVIVSQNRRSFWHGRRVMNILLACMVFAFVISWLFHFNVLS
ncbi:uncharacterized protein LOC130770370 [Actinidia eriantha]|uniref:uncharacterized protein LOC130770370 n=1 Tax=Actinidia eriantha TaxID=165200 RepID=UPI0025889DB2|nr:uncharacterized protein LOC130770370 [Actinidia eriantha]